MSWIAQTCILAYGWRRALIMLCAGAIGALSVPPLFFLPALFVAMPMWIWCLDGAEREKGLGRIFGPAFQIGFSFGLGYFVTSLHWVGVAFFVDGGWLLAAMPIAILVLAAVLAVFWGLASALAHFFWSHSWVRILALSVSLALAEFLRGHVLSGFPFNLLGYGLTANDTMMQFASLIGVYGLTFLVSVMAFLPALIWPADDRALAARLVPLFAVLSLFAVQLGYGQFRLNSIQVSERNDMRLRLVQPGITQFEKWLPGNQDFSLDRMISLSEAETDPSNTGLIGITHLIWPEAALPFFLDDYPESLVRIARMLPTGTTLLTGVPRRGFSPTEGEKEFNAILAINSDGEILATYDKTHLVPIGEYLPYQSALNSVGLTQFVSANKGWSHGAERHLMQTPSTPAFLPLICYEAIFSGGLGEETGQAQFILNLTNDAWFDGSIGPAQHFHHARIRAVEHGVPMIRVANSGRSAVIDPLGRLLGVMEPGDTGVIDSTMPNRINETFFSRFSNLPFFIAWILGMLIVLFTHFQRQKS